MHLTIYIANTVEGTAQEFVSRLPKEQRIRYVHQDQALGERTLFWEGDKKVVVTSLPISTDFCDYVRQTTGYARLVNLCPVEHSIELSRDIIADQHLMAQLSEVIYEARTASLYAYITSEAFLDLAVLLQAAHPWLQVPELMAKSSCELISLYDSKSGIRNLYTSLTKQNDIPCSMPEADICLNHIDVVNSSVKFAEKKKSFMVKPDLGESGTGILHFIPTNYTHSDILKGDVSKTMQNWPWREESCVVEVFIEKVKCSPGVQIRIPPLGFGSVNMVYICNQRLTPEGGFRGIDFGPNILSIDEGRRIKKVSLLLGDELQKLGYVGMCGLDYIIDEDGCLYFIEANLRRGGGSHVYGIARQLFGDGWRHMAIASYDHQKINEKYDITTLDTLLKRLVPVLYPMNGIKIGLVVSISNNLLEGTFGYVAIGHNFGEIETIEKCLEENLVV